MSTYEYTHISGSSLLIRDSTYPDRILLRIGFGSSKEGMHIPTADVPTIAAELLKAAGQESVIVPKANKEVEDFGHGNLRCGLTDVGFTSSSEWARDRAAELLALAEYREATATREAAEKAEAEAAEKKLQERRDALAIAFSADFTGHSFAYTELSPVARRAIDAYIGLQGSQP